jgi:hypothetical protein
MVLAALLFGQLRSGHGTSLCLLLLLVDAQLATFNPPAQPMLCLHPIDCSLTHAQRWRRQGWHGSQLFVGECCVKCVQMQPGPSNCLKCLSCLLHVSTAVIAVIAAIYACRCASICRRCLLVLQPTNWLCAWQVVAEYDRSGDMELWHVELTAPQTAV